MKTSHMHCKAYSIWVPAVIVSMLFGAVVVEARQATTELDPLVGTGNANRFELPLTDYISPSPTSGLDFGDVRNGDVYHLGEDIYASPGTPVFAAANGEVKLARSATDFEGVVIIEHHLPDDSYVCSIAGHLDPSSLHALGPVGVGDQIGAVASRADAHLHFGIRKGAYATWPNTDWGRTKDYAVLEDWWDPTRFVEEHSGQEPAENGLAYIGADGKIWLVDPDTGQQERLTASGPVQTFAWAPEGSAIAFEHWKQEGPGLPGYRQLSLLNLEESRTSVLRDRIDLNVLTMSWAPDGTQLALLAYGGTPNSGHVLLLEVSTGATTELVSWPAGAMGWEYLPTPAFGLSWSPDAQHLLVNAWPTFTAILGVAGDERASQTILSSFEKSDAPLMDRLCMGPHWSSDGQRILCRDSDAILVVDIQGTILREYPIADAGESASWSPDGAKIVADGHSGLWVIDTETGTVTQVLSRATWEPSWSPDGEMLAFSLYSGGRGASYSESIGMIRADGTALKELEQGSSLPTWQPAQAAPTSLCGAWDGMASDNRIELTRISESSGDECRGAFSFSNETEWWGDWGAYTLELEVRRMNNANAVWVTLLAPAESIESTFLLPALDRELHTFPLDRYLAAQVTVSGEMTLDSITADLALQAAGTAVDLITGGSCLIPKEQLAYAAASFAYILAPAARLIWEGDLDGAWEELQQRLPQFLERCGGVLKEVVSDCVSEGLKRLLGDPFVIAKLAGECIVWSAKAIWDYFDYQARPVYATMVYEVPVAAEPIVPPIHWAAPQRIGDIGQGGPTQQLLLDRDGRIWAFWEEHLQPSTAQHMYKAVHYRVWEQNAWGNLEDIPGSENYGEPSAAILADGSILVKAESAGEAPYGWFRWDGSEWSPNPRMSLLKRANESIRGLAADDHGSVHLLGLPVLTWDGISWRETGSIGSTYFHGAAVDASGDLHVVSQELASDQTVHIQHRTWDGDTWSTPETIYRVPAEPQTRTEPPALAIDVDGVLHLAWASSHWQVVQSGTLPPAPHWLSYARGDGGQWSDPETIFGPVTVDAGFWAPAIEVAPDGLVVIVWGDVKLGAGYRVHVTWGREGQWAEPLVLSPEDSNDHHWPDLEIDSSGNIHVLWSSIGGGVYHVVGYREALIPADR